MISMIVIAVCFLFQCVFQHSMCEYVFECVHACICVCMYLLIVMPVIDGL